MLDWIEKSIFGYYATNFKFFRKKCGGEWVQVTSVGKPHIRMWLKGKEKLGDIPLVRETYVGKTCYRRKAENYFIID